MKFDVYCDESYPDAIHSHAPLGKRLVIGSLWLPSEQRDELKHSIHELRRIHKIGGEFKWKKVSPSKLAFYINLVDLFFRQGNELRFRCISVERRRVDLMTFLQGDQELGFYKFYYQLLHHWIHDFNDYSIFLDCKRNRDSSRIPVLMRCLKCANVTSNIRNLQSVRSEESVLVQLSDILTGVASAKLNGTLMDGGAKCLLVDAVERRLGHEIRPTLKSEQKFNVFEIIPGGGW